MQLPENLSADMDPELLDQLYEAYNDVLASTYAVMAFEKAPLSSFAVAGNQAGLNSAAVYSDEQLTAVATPDQDRS